MIFVDVNVPMYLVGADHPNKQAAAEALEGAVRRGERLVSDAEVLQEILHRYRAIRRPEAIQPAFDVLEASVDEILPIGAADVRLAKEIVLDDVQASARDALHVAVMRRHDIDTIMTFGKGFERYPGIRRIS